MLPDAPASLLCHIPIFLMASTLPAGDHRHRHCEESGYQHFKTLGLMTTITFDIHHFTPEVQDFLFKLHNAIQDSIKVSTDPASAKVSVRETEMPEPVSVETSIADAPTAGAARTLTLVEIRAAIDAKKQAGFVTKPVTSGFLAEHGCTNLPGLEKLENFQALAAELIDKVNNME
jgi:hypothetical protein